MVMSSCDREEDPAKDVGFFDKISANGGIDVKFIQGTENKVLTTTLGETQYYADGETLTINGTGKMTIAINDLESFFCNGCDLECHETLFLDSTKITIHAGSAEFNNLVISNYGEFVFQNTGSYKFKGSALKAKVSLTNNPRFEGYGFVCDTLDFNAGYVNAEVHAKKLLDVSIYGGNPTVTYKGDPDSVRTSIVGSGQVVPY